MLNFHLQIRLWTANLQQSVTINSLLWTRQTIVRSIILRLQIFVFSLGAFLYMAADYSLKEDEVPSLSQDFETLIAAMTKDDHSDRPSLATIKNVRHLQCFSP